MTLVWFITGCSRGLGKALATYALESGDQVVATARDPAALGELAAKYGADRFLGLALDVTDYGAAQATARQAHQHFGRVDVVVNNAGYADTGAIEDTPMDSFRAQVETNFYGVVHVSKAFVPLLREQAGGHIFQVSSLGGRLGSPGLSAYQSAKWAVGGFSTCLAAEVAPLGVKVTVLEPGAMLTDWAGSSMKVVPVSAPYEASVGAFAAMLKKGFGSEVTRPEQVGPIIRALHDAPDPPVRMLVGQDAVDYGPAIAKAQATSDEKWKALGNFSAEWRHGR